MKRLEAKKVMDRLTGWDKGNAYMRECFERTAEEGGCENMCSDKCIICEANYAIFKRLAEYEDSGLMPEQVQDLKQENEKALERLQKSPYGDDKIDELE
jgi:hypothetical protein